MLRLRPNLKSKNKRHQNLNHKPKHQSSIFQLQSLHPLLLPKLHQLLTCKHLFPKPQLTLRLKPNLKSKRFLKHQHQLPLKNPPKASTFPTLTSSTLLLPLRRSHPIKSP